MATGNLSKDMLKTEDAFIVDNDTEIFVWVGKGATADERKAALSHGQDYVSKQGRPDWTRVTKILEGTEPTTFKSCFKKWQVAAASPRRPSPPPLPAAPGTHPAHPAHGPPARVGTRWHAACPPPPVYHPATHPPHRRRAWILRLAELAALPTPPVCLGTLRRQWRTLAPTPHPTLHARRTQRTLHPSTLTPIPHPSPVTRHPPPPIGPMGRRRSRRRRSAHMALMDPMGPMGPITEQNK